VGCYKTESSIETTQMCSFTVGLAGLLQQTCVILPNAQILVSNGILQRNQVYQMFVVFVYYFISEAIN